MTNPVPVARSFHKLLTRQHVLPLLGYAALVLALTVIAWLSIASLAGDYADYLAAADMLDQLEGRKASAEAPWLSSGKPGSPFLEGPTVEVAGAALQKRLVSAVESAGGSVLSSQIDLQGSESKPGYVSLSAACEIDQSSLQALLYELESGMPFLFIDQLVVQVPQADRGMIAAASSEPARMRVQIDVSGQWQVSK
jgi:general secretion pathway protein M